MTKLACLNVRALRKLGCLAALASVLLAGCQRGMYDQPRYEPLEATEFGPFEDGRSSRTLVPGTVARGRLRLDEHLYTGRVDGELATDFPFEITPAVMERGRERFNIYCSVCHGIDGEGRGMVVRRGFKPPPSLHEARLREQTPPGHYFEVISRGFGVMPSYAGQITAPDRWAITAYVRALQLSQHATREDLPAAALQTLEELP